MSKARRRSLPGHGLSRRKFLTTVGAAATAFAVPHVVLGQAKPFAGKTLSVHFWSGPEGDTIIKNVVDPFKAETGAEVVVDYGNTASSIAKLRAQKNDPQLDVTMMDDVGVYETAPEGLLMKIDPAKIPNLKDVDPHFIVKDGLGIGFFTFGDTLVYNTNYYKSAPTTYEALWDPKLKGKVGLPPSDGTDAMKLIVLSAKLAGGDEFHIEPGFKKLAALKPNVHSFISDFAAGGELMKKGDIVLMYYLPYLWKEQMAKGYPIRGTTKVKEGVYTAIGTCAIPKGHPGSHELAELFINRAVSAQAQTGMAAGLWWGPTNKNVKISDPSITDNLVMPVDFPRVLQVDPVHLAKVRQEWIQRYDQVLKG
jgi:putative spermidine/putrescine transport system substrate-binding protein